MTNARTSDPFTSHLAGRAIESTGAAHDQRTRVLDMVRLAPGLTSAELARAMGIERHIPARRLSELKTAELVETRGNRHCAVVGSLCMTWWPASKKTAAKPVQQNLFEMEPAPMKWQGG